MRNATTGKRLLMVMSLLLILAAPVGLAFGQTAGVTNWKMTTGWSTGMTLYTEMAVYFAKEVDKMSNGRLKIATFPGGAIAPALETSEAVRTGVAQAGHLWSGWDMGKDRTSVLFGGFAASGKSEEMVHWLYGGGGYDLWKQWRLEKFNLVGMPMGIRPQEVFLHSHRLVKTLADLKGLKIRTVGAWAEILPGLGASVVSLPGDEVLPALERKVIDATEWATPGENVLMGFHEVARFVIIPGVHQPSAPFELVINKRAWDALSEDLKEIVEQAAKATTLHSWTRLGVDDFGAMEKFARNKNVIVKMDPAVGVEAIRLANEWADKHKAGNPWFEKVLKSKRDFSANWAKVVDNR